MNKISQNLIIEELKEEYVGDLTTFKKFIEDEFEVDFSNRIYRHVALDLYDFLNREPLPWDKEFYKDFSSDENRIFFIKNELKNLQIMNMVCEQFLVFQD